MTLHLEHIIASVLASSVASERAVLPLDAPVPLYRQPTAGQCALWPMWDRSSWAGIVFVGVNVYKLVQAGIGMLSTSKQILCISA